MTEKPVRPVLLQVVHFEPYWQDSSYAGEVRARYETALGFRIDGKIVQRNVEVGQRGAPVTSWPDWTRRTTGSGCWRRK